MNHEEHVAQLLNNASIDHPLRAPQLANELIVTEKLKPRVVEKRLRTRDAG